MAKMSQWEPTAQQALCWKFAPKIGLCNKCFILI